jgi:GNAT superfamily N-acetyltransferase
MGSVAGLSTDHWRFAELEAAKYEAVEALRDGRRFKVRALRPDDRAGLLSAVDRSSPQSLYRRFFSPKRGFTEEEIARFVNVVVDHYQGQGVGAALMRHLAMIARDAGLKELIAEVLADNISMLKVFAKSGLRVDATREAGVVHVALHLL